MKEISISTLGGFMYRMNSLDTNIFEDNTEFFKDTYFDINSLFWRDFFSEKNVIALVNKLCAINNTYNNPDLSIHEKVIIKNPDLFIEQYRHAKKNLLDSDLSAEETFSYLEVFEIICSVYTSIISSPFRICIENGFMSSKYSSYEMYNNCLLEYRNPYLKFIENKIIPVIKRYNPNIVWFLGQPNIATFCIARKIKHYNPDVIFIICSHSSEFYSMNKIIPLLKKNEILFRLFDYILLDDSKTSITKLRETIKNKGDISTVNNILYRTTNGEQIIQNKISCINAEDFYNRTNNSSDIANVKLFPANYCYWRKCSFCGINGKYLFKSSDSWDIDSACKILKSCIDNGASKIWVLDEAIPPEIINKIAIFIKENNIRIDWHVRTRIDKYYLSEDHCRNLSQSGLKHILFGLESASKRTIESMQKTDILNYLEVTEKIVDNMNKCGIYVHFPVIIGYPGETQSERQETYDFLNYLYDTYPMVSYNINIFNLDITSKIFKEWSNYNITDIHFPCNPKYFLENHLEWECSYAPIDKKILEEECENQMKKQYPWIPSTSNLSVTIFDYLWENMRGRFKTRKSNNNHKLDARIHFVFIKNLVFFKENDGKYILYNYNNHQIIIGGELLNDLYNNKVFCLNDILNIFPDNVHNEITELFKRLYAFEFIEERRDGYV